MRSASASARCISQRHPSDVGRSRQGAVSTAGRGRFGVFETVDDAIRRAPRTPSPQLQKRPLADRERIVQIVKTMCERNANQWGREELEEASGIGRLDHKIEKLQIIKKVPAPNG